MHKEYLEKLKKKLEKMTIMQRVVSGVLLLLIAVTGIYFYNPSKKLLEWRNSQRRSDVVNILNAVHQYGTENPEALNELLSEQPQVICRTKAASCEGLLDISQIIAAEKKILSKVPVDPRSRDKNSSGYEISRLNNGRISVNAPLAENGAVITLSK